MAKNSLNMESTTTLRQIQQKSLAGFLHKPGRCVSIFGLSLYPILANSMSRLLKSVTKIQLEPLRAGHESSWTVTRCPGCFLHPRQARPHDSDTLIHKGVYVSQSSSRPFVFTSCQLTGRSTLEK